MLARLTVAIILPCVQTGKYVIHLKLICQMSIISQLKGEAKFQFEVNKNKKVLFFLTQTPEQLEIPPSAEKTHARETLKLKDKA